MQEISPKLKNIEMGLARAESLCYNNTAVCDSISSADENKNIL